MSRLFHSKTATRAVTDPEEKGSRTLSDPVPFDLLLDDLMLGDSSDESSIGILRSVYCLREGDFRGAVLAASGAVDAITEKFYWRKNLGDPRKATLAEKVSRCIHAAGNFDVEESYLVDLGWELEEARLIRENLRSVLNDGADLMAKLRAHIQQPEGTDPPGETVVAEVVKQAKILVSLLSIDG